MRVVSYSTMIPVLFLVLGGAFTACSDDVNVDSTTSSGSGGATGGGGTGGAGGEAASSSTTAASSSSTTGGGGKGGAGGAPSLCDQACDHAGMCGAPLCALADINCDSGMNYDCYATCILDASCAQIFTLADPQNADPKLAGCLQACLGGAGGGGGGGGMGGAGGGMGGAGGGGTQACINCGFQNCQAEGFACNQDPECQPWLNCLQGCPDKACVDQCTQNNPKAEPESVAVQACLCKSCSSECAVIDVCGMGGAGGGGGAGGMGGAGGAGGMGGAGGGMGGAGGGMGGAGGAGGGMGGAGGN
jgi:hypothetical protein